MDIKETFLRMDDDEEDDENNEDDDNNHNHNNDNTENGHRLQHDHSKNDKSFHQHNSLSSATDSRGSSSTDTTSTCSDVVNLSNSKHSTQQTNTMRSEKQTALFIGDLPGNVTERMLNDIFSKFKSFNSVKICVDSNTKKSLGYGYLNFGDLKDAESAVDEYNYMPIFGREIRMMPSLRNTYFRKNIGTNVFFSNLPLDNTKLTTRVFYDEFKKFGKILSCKLDRRKNIGFIYFENDSAAKEAISQYNGEQFFGNTIMCGVHFDRNVRKSPEFEQKIGRINNLTVVKEKLEIEDADETCTPVETHDDTNHSTSKKGDSTVAIDDNTVDKTAKSPVEENTRESKLPHPNAIFVKNLPINPSHDSLLNFFSKIGPVKSVYTSDVSKFDSSWAFITYKRIQDTKVAIEKLNGCKYMKRVIEVKKAERNHLEENNIENNTRPNNYKKTVFLTNLSIICNEEFLNFFCGQERIKTEQVVVKYYDEKTDTYSGYVKCATRNDAQRLFELMENKLLGDSEVKASWKQLSDVKLVEIEPSYRSGASFNDKRNRGLTQGYLYRAPAPNYRPPKVTRNTNNAPGMKLPQKNSIQYHKNLNPHLQQQPHQYQLQNTYHYGGNMSQAMLPRSSVAIGNSSINKGAGLGVGADELSRKAYSYEAKKQLITMLKKETKRCIDFLQHPVATRDENISTIASYIMDVYYKPNYDALAQLLLLKTSNNYYERVFQSQVELAIEKLGLQER
ncbi:unnamed protein product [Kluyveromyces dobzhanskii CBS 2104]|uniref:WGS project CCBQ000000000 data, contig 00107 n=2 Tax=Kluyveromyces dobzhanskii CBS 2104 TaxID=1427455 RepID=A0A0A8L0W3_9SACH|nr:unnamed protein product [Kluyveromyces dobzhanskii CBS 2104]